ncbi:MAG: LysM peptidoglycan-binding domain-containing protein [Crocinitomicaceae bacterium]|nr:LysM peptidoglycan-binding domain-containing protein [Crocinitomicaceae bacterium]
MGLEKLSITAYSDSTYLSEVDFCIVQINPASYKHSHKVNYDSKVPIGASGAELEFQGIPPETVSFKIYFDGTGIVDEQKNIQDLIDIFKEVCFKYQDEIHQPNYLIISWGTLVFKCKLTSLELNYTLFKPDGTPLRAEAEVSFEEALDALEISKDADNKSPDLTHEILIKAGDNLPQICFNVYGDSSYYLDVAKYNGLTNFRNLKPGTVIHLPSLK